MFLKFFITMGILLRENFRIDLCGYSKVLCFEWTLHSFLNTKKFIEMFGYFLSLFQK